MVPGKYIVMQESERRFVVGRRATGDTGLFRAVCWTSSPSNAEDIAKALNEYDKATKK